jgi:hypothetical protein
MLLKCNWKNDKSDMMLRFFENDAAHMTNPVLKLMLRRETEEINLNLDVDLELIDTDE